MSQIEITWGSLWKVFALVAFGAALILAKDAVLALALAIVISAALDGPVTFLSEKMRMPRFVGAALIYLLALVLIAIAVSIVLPVVLLEITSLATELSGTAAGSAILDIKGLIKAAGSGFSITTLSQLSEIILSGASPVAATVGNIFGGITFILSVVVISFYLTLTRDGVGRFLKVILPGKVENAVLASYYRTKKKIGRWLQAQIFLSLAVGTAVSGTLLLLNVKNALVIGLIAGLFEIMPVVGPIFSGAVGVLIAMSQSFSLGLVVLVVFIAVQQLENHILVPLFMKKVVDIHPVAALFSLLAGYQILGIAGMIISVPITVIVQDILEMRLEKKRKDALLSANN